MKFKNISSLTFLFLLVGCASNTPTPTLTLIPSTQTQTATATLTPAPTTTLTPTPPIVIEGGLLPFMPNDIPRNTIEEVMAAYPGGLPGIIEGFYKTGVEKVQPWDCEANPCATKFIVWQSGPEAKNLMSVGFNMSKPAASIDKVPVEVLEVSIIDGNAAGVLFPKVVNEDGGFGVSLLSEWKVSELNFLRITQVMHILVKDENGKDVSRDLVMTGFTDPNLAFGTNGVDSTYDSVFQRMLGGQGEHSKAMPYANFVNQRGDGFGSGLMSRLGKEMITFTYRDIKSGEMKTEEMMLEMAWGKVADQFKIVETTHDYEDLQDELKQIPLAYIGVTLEGFNKTK